MSALVILSERSRAKSLLPEARIHAGRLVVAMSLIGAFANSQSPRFRAGDHWALDRTVRFLKTADGIDMQNEDHFDFLVRNADGKLYVEVSRRQTGTRLSDGVFVPSPPGGEPEKWKLPLSTDGKLTLDRQPSDPFERFWARIVLSAWNGAPLSDDKGLIAVIPLAGDRMRVTFDGSQEQNPAKLEGEVTFDPVSRAPILISLHGDNLAMPGGPGRVSVRVEYKRSKI